MTAKPVGHFLRLVPALAGLPEHLFTPETSAEREVREAREVRELWDVQQRGQASREQQLHARGVPAKDIDRLVAAETAAPGGLRETEALARCRRWLAEDRRILVLGGPPDAGKTTAAAWAAAQEPSAEDRRWWDERAGVPQVVYLEAELLLGVWLNRAGKESLTGRTREDLVTCWLLVIDDLGQEASTDGIVAMVGEAIDVLLRLRSDRRLRTLITTNIERTPGHAKIVERYGARGVRIRERLQEHGAWCPCKAIGLRRARGEEGTAT